MAKNELIKLKDADDIPPALLSELREWRNMRQDYDEAMKLLAQHGFRATPSEISNWCNKIFRAPRISTNGGEDREASISALEQALSTNDIMAYSMARRTLKHIKPEPMGNKERLATLNAQHLAVKKSIENVNACIKAHSEFDDTSAAKKAEEQRALEKVAATYQMLSADDPEASAVMQRLASKAAAMNFPNGECKSFSVNQEEKLN